MGPRHVEKVYVNGGRYHCINDNRILINDNIEAVLREIMDKARTKNITLQNKKKRNRISRFIIREQRCLGQYHRIEWDCKGNRIWVKEDDNMELTCRVALLFHILWLNNIVI